MNTTNYIRIFRGDDSDALGYQTIVGTIKTDLDLAGCKAVFRFLGFYAEFNPIPDDKKLTIVIPAQASRGFPPGVGYASLKVFDSLGKIRTFTNRIPVIVDTMTPSCGCGEFEVSFSPFPELEPLKIFIGPNADDFDQYTGFVSKIIDRASLVKYGLAMLVDEMGKDGGNDGKAASPLAVKAAYDAIITELTNNYYTAAETDEAINSVAAYYITRNAAGDAFETKAQLDSATVFYSGGNVRVPTRNDYCVVLADETHDNAEYRYIYAVAEGQTTGSWQPQFPVGGIMTIDSSVTKNSSNPVTSSGIWSAIWGALSALPTGFTSLYDWVVSQLALKQSKITASGVLKGDGAGGVSAATAGTDFQAPLSQTQLDNIAAVPNKANDNAVVHLEGNETVGGVKTFDSEGVVVHDLQTGFSMKLLGTGIAVTDGSITAYFYVPSIAGGGGTFALLSDLVGKADKDESATPGNLAKFDSQGNPVDSDWTAGDLARYALVTKTIDNGAVSLDDRASNSVTISAALSPNTLTINFPTATSGKVRDFAMRLNIAAGVTAPEIAWPQGVALENDGGEVPEIADGGTGGSSTILYFSETENDGTTAKFLVKGEALTAITQA